MTVHNRFFRTATFILASAALMMPFRASAQSERNRVGLDFGFYGDQYHLGLSYHYMLIPYAGIGGSIGYWTETPSDGLLADIQPDNPWYDDLYFDDYDDRDAAFYIEPSIILESPRLTAGKFELGLTANASFRFSTNHYSVCYFRDENDRSQEIGYKCDNITTGFTVGPTLHIGPASLTVGYMFSTLDIDRSYNAMTHSFTRHPVHGLFFNLGGRF